MAISNYLPTVSGFVDSAVLFYAAKTCFHIATEKIFPIYDEIMFGNTPIDKVKTFTGALLGSTLYLASLQLIAQLYLHIMSTKMQAPHFVTTSLVKQRFTWI